MKWISVIKSIKFVLYFAILGIAGPCFTQDLHFSQFFEAPLLRNPSLAGIFTGDYRVQGVYRDQWNSVTDGYRTGSFNAEYKMPSEAEMILLLPVCRFFMTRRARLRLRHPSF